MSPSQSEARREDANTVAVVAVVSILAVIASFALLWSTPVRENTAVIYADLIIMFASLFSAVDAVDKFLHIVP